MVQTARRLGGPQIDPRVLYQMLTQDLKIPPNSALGAVYGLAGESGVGLHTGSLNPKDGRDGSDSIGAGQWNGSRGKALIDLAKGMGVSWKDPGAQLQHIKNELLGPYSGVLQKLRSADDVNHGANVWTASYESPAVNNYRARVAQGNRYIAPQLGLTLNTAGAQSAIDTAGRPGHTGYVPPLPDPINVGDGGAVAPLPDTPAGPLSPTPSVTASAATPVPEAPSIASQLMAGDFKGALGAAGKSDLIGGGLKMMGSGMGGGGGQQQAPAMPQAPNLMGGGDAGSGNSAAAAQMMAAILASKLGKKPGARGLSLNGMA